MIVLGLLILGLALVYCCAHALVRASWPARSPHAALWSWLALLTAGLTGTAWIGLMAVASVQHLGVDVGHLLHACLVTAADGFQHRSAFLTTTAGVVACAGLLRVGCAAARDLCTGHRIRREQRMLLDLVGLPQHSGGPLRVVPADQPLAYCVPGAGGRIVLSTALRDLLDADELEAVLAHERAHLAGRHHLLLLPARALLAAAPRLRAARRVASAMTTLVEMAADDRACLHAPRRSLVGALLKIGGAPQPTAGLAASGGATGVRIMRLLQPPAAAAPGRDRLLVASGAVLLALPWLVAGVPAGLAVTGHCYA